MDIFKQISELELELQGVADATELAQIRRELKALRAQVQVRELELNREVNALRAQDR